MTSNPRQVAFLALQEFYQHHAYGDVALERILQNYPTEAKDRHLASELVYGILRRKRTLDSLINQLGTKKASSQPLPLRIILQIGLYQLRYLEKIPPFAAVDTSVELAKANGLGKLAPVVNAILRNYIRKSSTQEPLVLPTDRIAHLGVKYSFPDWIVSLFQKQFGGSLTEELLQWFNQTPTIDIRVNILLTTREKLQETLQEEGIETETIPYLPQALRIKSPAGNLAETSLFKSGWFTIQDGSAQLVTHFLNPQPGEIVIDACAAPGGKTTHMAELMGDRGKIIAVEYHPQRLAKIQENVQRLGLTSVEIHQGDSRHLNQWEGMADRVLIDVPCSGLGILHRNPDIRWLRKPQQIQHLTELQGQLLENCSKWVKKGGILVYSTCTLNQAENEAIILRFLQSHPQWQWETKNDELCQISWLLSEKKGRTESMVTILPPLHHLDGFFMAKLRKGD
ncbi:MAG: 16S rRNA (cytosine(967)-C(5))-methyltransferase [Geminocystis sp.]|nr:16S rRNA (cytosine(967)-C(5))-methyltransferase [Geminocystis sp.]HIK37696.1 16S rRNA (cytosine(967)-C(5))-methyltransferase [Geminocystis sp. M7585_C2015_104]MCS7147237.1 16S rRNA (cytosine(967)-C(5))-methyltransferase [Geminocystis sp.]MCX8078538.1 16S rRNA (cytosine(967)-C(5))-methyltransferase [Geminocystis sp.]MDW8116233.1 16S rRNA (cytosine(967)-C(5))-methyltransferase [Geminocystis sp.]